MISGTPLCLKDDVFSYTEPTIDYDSVPPVGNSPVKHSPLLLRRENNPDFRRQPSMPKTPEVRLR